MNPYKEKVKQWNESFRYQLLSRMQSDCEYYLGCGHRLAKHLWAGDEAGQIGYMKALWNSFPSEGKPEWLSYEQILEYEKNMVTKEDGMKYLPITDEEEMLSQIEAKHYSDYCLLTYRDEWAREHGISDNQSFSELPRAYVAFQAVCGCIFCAKLCGIKPDGAREGILIGGTDPDLSEHGAYIHRSTAPTAVHAKMPGLWERITVRRQKRRIKRLSELATQNLLHIPGLPKHGPNSARRDFLHTGRAFLRTLAKSMGFQSWTVRTVSGGPEVPGMVNLDGMWTEGQGLRVSVTQGCKDEFDLCMYFYHTPKGKWNGCETTHYLSPGVLAVILYEDLCAMMLNYKPEESDYGRAV